jgi:hypothetical protein
MESAPKIKFDPLRYHSEQARLWTSPARFNVVPAGRRSGKTEIVGKRKIILRALIGTKFQDARFFVAAPTRDQAKRIYWNDLKRLSPKSLLAKPPSETELKLTFINGSEVHVLGMDKPERVEGTPWDGGVLDEYGNMKIETWPEHIRPALSDRLGWCDFIGVPEGRNHYYKLYNEAQKMNGEWLARGLSPEWDTFWWPSSDILPQSEIEAAKRDLDELTYEQEYEGSFINFTGQAYYAFDERKHCARLLYSPDLPLLFMFDFNVTPGVACVCQEQALPGGLWGTGIIGEVWIPRNSNTIRVCDKLIQDWGSVHRGKIICYGDSTGGSRGTAKVLGSDWQLIKQKLWNHFGHGRVFFKVPNSNPRERDRVNSVNSRFLSVSNEIRMMLDPARAPHTKTDLEGARVIEGGTGEIDKDSDPELTHLTDALGYYVYREYPIKKRYTVGKQIPWK